ncbi:hypothetical protein SGL43_04959 [Streptomyces globisporus]|uniref:Uncharacterized protein n=1 Tax=Streptomyces globisporus TaxID=1908 RepID=A0ABM9H2T2_STRGL|nr:hypothetical protein SGL43_04959 [Streptomyces globisporus]
MSRGFRKSLTDSAGGMPRRLMEAVGSMAVPGQPQDKQGAGSERARGATGAITEGRPRGDHEDGNVRAGSGGRRFTGPHRPQTRRGRHDERVSAHRRPAWERSPRGCVDRSPEHGRRGDRSGRPGGRGGVGPVVRTPGLPRPHPRPPATAVQQTIASRTQEYGNSCRTFIVP